MVEEEWRPVLGWENLYEVSNLGRVKSLASSFKATRRGKLTEVRKKERLLRTPLTAGYPSVALCCDGTSQTAYVHRLVCEAWHGPPLGRDAAHNDGNKENNSSDNLRWATRTENHADKVKHGTQKRGEELWFTKVPNAVVVEIRRDRQKPNRQWAAELGVSQSLISGIRRGERRSTMGAL